MIQVVLLSPNSSEDPPPPKKDLHQKLKDIYPLNRVKIKKKDLYRNLALYSARTGGIYSRSQALFRLIIQPVAYAGFSKGGQARSRELGKGDEN